MKRYKSKAFFADRSVVTAAIRELLSAKPYRRTEERIAERWFVTSYEPGHWGQLSPMHVLISEDDDGRIRVRAEVRHFWALNLAGWDPILRSFLNAVNERLNATGICVQCGYDLRHADHEKCPECGKPLRGRKRT